MWQLHTSSYERREHDFYATRDLRVVPALLAVLRKLDISISGTVADLCCGEGHLLQHFEDTNLVYGADIVHRGYKHQVATTDLLQTDALPTGVQFVVGNLPYVRGTVNQLTQHLINLTQAARGTLCLLFRHQFAAGFDTARRILFETPYFVGEFRLPFRPFFELPRYVWGRDITPTPQHPYAWYVWDFSREWQGITRYTPTIPNLSIFSPKDISTAQKIDTNYQTSLIHSLSLHGSHFERAFARLRCDTTLSKNGISWKFHSDKTPFPTQLAEALLTNSGAKRFHHFGRLLPANATRQEHTCSKLFKWQL